MKLTITKIAKIGILIALAVGLNLVLLGVPNIELISFIVFSSGYFLGIAEGGVVGFLAMLIYSLFNPYGMPPFPILLAQVIGMSLIGSVGGITVKSGWLSKAKLANFFLIGLLGLILTFVYDLLTNLAVAYTVGQFLPVLVGGIVFSLVHIFSNVVIFTVLAPVTYKVKAIVN